MEDALKTILEKSSLLIFIKDRQRRYVAVSDAYASLFGYKSGNELVGKTDDDLVTVPENAGRFADIDTLVMNNGVILYDMVEPNFSSASDVRWISASKYPVRDISGKIIGLVSEGRVIENRFDRRTAYEYDLRSVVELSSDAYGAIMCDLTDGRVVEFHNPGSWMTGITVGMTWDALIAVAKQHILSDDEEAREIFSAIRQQKIMSMYRNSRKTFSVEYYWDEDTLSRWVRNEAHIFTNPDTGHLLLAMILHNVGAEHEARAELVRKANRDSLTGLLNHRETVRRIQAALLRGKRGCLFMMDVDAFKSINDTFGHPVGDETLAAIAKIVRESFRAEDIVGRVGGDEFMIYSENLGDISVARAKGLNILEQVRKLRISNSACRAAVSIGIVRFSAHEDFAQLYSRADAMLYVSKKLGKDRVITEEDFGEHKEIPAEDFNGMESAVVKRSRLFESGQRRPTGRVFKQTEE